MISVPLIVAICLAPLGAVLRHSSAGVRQLHHLYRGAAPSTFVVFAEPATGFFRLRFAIIAREITMQPTQVLTRGRGSPDES